jgi:hypothetical protein
VLTITENILVVVITIGASLGFWWLVRWVWPPELRRDHNDITGWQISVLGTTYAVIIGFMLFAAWADFRAAEQNAEVEATCLINLYWAASGLPESQRAEIRKLAVNYADTMLTEEWPAMNEGHGSHTATEIIQKLWAAVSRSQPLNASEQVSLERTMGEISSITEHRRIRLLQNETSLPLVLWLVLIVGALVTLMSACLFGSNNPTLHLLQTVTLALLLSLSLVAIADINRPFRGAVHVLPTGIENAKRIFAAFHQEQMPH